MENGKVLEEEYNILGILDRHIVLEEPEILDEKKKEQEENADYYFNEAEKIIKENDNHIPRIDQKKGEENVRRTNGTVIF